MWAFRGSFCIEVNNYVMLVRLERLTQIRFHQLQASKDPKDKIHNAQVSFHIFK